MHASGLQVYVECTTVEHNKKLRIITSGTASLRMSAGESVQHTSCWTGCAGGAVQEPLVKEGHLHRIMQTGGCSWGHAGGVQVEGSRCRDTMGDCAIGGLQAVLCRRGTQRAVLEGFILEGHAGVVILEGAVVEGSCRRGQRGGPLLWTGHAGGVILNGLCWMGHAGGVLLET